MLVINGGVTSPEGFFANGISCGIKKSSKKDLAIVCSEDTAVVAGMFTKNKVKGHSLQLTMEHIKNGYARAIVINSGNANACVGEQGYKDAKEIATLTASLLDCESEDILLGSTGIIGVPLNMGAIRSGIKNIIADMSPKGGANAALAIMTTDTVPKEIAVELQIQGEKVRIGGMAKGSGMIHPNMATMIAVITTDVNISKPLLQKSLNHAVNKSFNKISVDGETSVCDMVVIFANGQSENEGLVKEDAEFAEFQKALNYVCTELAKMIVRDGEGATKLVEIEVNGAASPEDAYIIAASVAKSPLVKTAFYGEDANWGRIITAVGYSDAEIDPNLIDVHIGNILVCRNGSSINFDENEAKKELAKKDFSIKINLKKGTFSDKVWTCDFSNEYIKINSAYRT